MPLYEHERQTFVSQLNPRLRLIAASRAVLAACDVQQRSAHAQSAQLRATALSSRATALSSAQHAQSTQLTL